MLSRAAQKLAQDVRRAQDLALSGHSSIEQVGQQQIAGYGIYINVSDNIQYIIYEDKVVDSSSDKKYTNSTDEIIETIDISGFAVGVHIREINGVETGSASINFSPPNPLITLTMNSTDQQNIEVTLCMDDYCTEADRSMFRTVAVNKSGLIEIK